MMNIIFKSAIILFLLVFSLTDGEAQSSGENIFKAQYRSTQISQYNMAENDYKPMPNGYSVADVVRGTSLHFSLYLNLKDRTSLYLHDSTTVKPMLGMRSSTNIIIDFSLKSADQKTFKKERIFDQQFYSEGEVGNIEWDLTNEIKEINGLKCYKAIAKDRDLMLTAYYTKEIPVSSGPSIFQGLPGLVVWVEDYFTTIELVDVEYIDMDSNQFQEMFDSLLSGFNEKRNDKFRVEESIVLLKKVGAAHDLYKRNHGKDY